MKHCLTLLLLIAAIFGFSQEKLETQVDVAAMPIGGKVDVEYVIQSQLIYPEKLLKEKIAQDVVIYFTVNAQGNLQDVLFKQDYKEEFKTEAKRLLHFFNFSAAKIGNVNVASQSFLIIKFNPDNYKKWVKKRGYLIPKNNEQIDTSFVVYQRVDEMPQYIKGNDGLVEFIKENLEYPDLAIRQNIQGTVMLNFIIEPSGTVSNLIAEKEFNYLCTQEAYKIIRQTKWNPATLNGKLVRYKMKYPIVFNLNNINKDNASGEQR